MTRTGPREPVKAWVKAFNRADVGALMSFYREDAVNHQVVDKRVEGRSDIGEMLATEFAKAKMASLSSNIFEDGDWAALEWPDPKGLRGCGFFQVTDGKIAFQRGSWDKPSFLQPYGLPLPAGQKLIE
jgi:hypothetical protein